MAERRADADVEQGSGKSPLHWERLMADGVDAWVNAVQAPRGTGT